jgi:hypothetical protein
MTQAGPLIWATGAGWLVLTGSEERDRGETAELDDRLLALADFSRPVAFLPTAGGSLKEAEVLLDDYAELGGPHGYVVPIHGTEDALDRENRDLLAEAGLIVLGGGDPRVLAQTLRGTPALEGMVEAFVRRGRHRAGRGGCAPWGVGAVCRSARGRRAGLGLAEGCGGGAAFRGRRSGVRTTGGAADVAWTGGHRRSRGNGPCVGARGTGRDLGPRRGHGRRGPLRGRRGSAARGTAPRWSGRQARGGGVSRRLRVLL